MIVIVALGALAAMIYAGMGFVHAITCQPLTASHREQLERMQVSRTILFIAAGLVLGFALENML